MKVITFFDNHFWCACKKDERLRLWGGGAIKRLSIESTLLPTIILLGWHGGGGMKVCMSFTICLRYWPVHKEYAPRKKKRKKMIDFYKGQNRKGCLIIIRKKKASREFLGGRGNSQVLFFLIVFIVAIKCNKNLFVCNKITYIW